MDKILAYVIQIKLMFLLKNSLLCHGIVALFLFGPVRKAVLSGSFPCGNSGNFGQSQDNGQTCCSQDGVASITTKPFHGLFVGASIGVEFVAIIQFPTRDARNEKEGMACD